MISPSQGPLPDNTQHSQETETHASGAIRTRNPSKPAAADSNALDRTATGIGRTKPRLDLTRIESLFNFTEKCRFKPHVMIYWSISPIITVKTQAKRFYNQKPLKVKLRLCSGITHCRITGYEEIHKYQHTIINL